MNAGKFLMALAIACVGAGSLVSILAIWDVIEDSSIVWRSLSTMAVVLFGTLMSSVILGIYNRGDD